MKDTPGNTTHDLRLCLLQGLCCRLAIARFNGRLDLADKGSDSRCAGAIDLCATKCLFDAFACLACVGHMIHPEVCALPEVGGIKFKSRRSQTVSRFHREKSQEAI